MARGFEVAVGADGREFEQGIKKDVIKPVEEAARSLDELADAGEDAGRDGARGLDRLEDALKDAQRQSEKTERAVDDIGTTGGSSFRKLGDKGAEVGNELKQNLGESLSSFRGDLSDLPQIAQDTLGGLAGAGALGGIGGIAATAAGAAGLGLVIGAMENIGAQSELTKQTVSENFREMAENGVASWESAKSQMQRLTEAYDQHADEINRIKDLTGLTFETIAAAWAGNKDAVAQVDAAYAQMKADLRDVPGATNDATRATIDGWNGIMGPLQNVLDGYEQAKTKAEQLGAQQSEVWKQAIRDAGTAAEEVDEVGNRLYRLPNGEEVFIDVETGRASANVDRFRGDLDNKIPTVKTSTVKFKSDTSALDSALDKYRNKTIRVGAIQASVLRAPDGRRLLQ